MCMKMSNTYQSYLSVLKADIGPKSVILWVRCKIRWILTFLFNSEKVARAVCTKVSQTCCLSLMVLSLSFWQYVILKTCINLWTIKEYTCITQQIMKHNKAKHSFLQVSCMAQEETEPLEQVSWSPCLHKSDSGAQGCNSVYAPVLNSQTSVA